MCSKNNSGLGLKLNKMNAKIVFNSSKLDLDSGGDLLGTIAKESISSF